MKRILWLACLTSLVLATRLTACTSANTGPTPPEIVFGQDVCDECGMLISDPQYAAATVLKDGTAHKFDDIGEMVIYHMDRPNEVIAAWFVHDHTSEGWVRGETAWYVMSTAIHSPMEMGVVAFAQRAEAEAFAADMQATVFNFDEMRAQVHMTGHQ